MGLTWQYVLRLPSPGRCLGRAYPHTGSSCVQWARSVQDCLAASAVSVPTPHLTSGDPWHSVRRLLQPCDNSNAFLNLRSDSANRRRCTLPSRIPHTMRSRNMSSRVASNWQCSESRRSSATNSPIDSPSFWARVLNRNRCTMTDGGGVWCSFTSFTIAEKVLLVGLSRATRLRMSWYVAAPQTLKRIARFFAASLTSLARKYCSRRSQYAYQSSTPRLNSPTLPCVAIGFAPRRQFCILTGWPTDACDDKS